MSVLLSHLCYYMAEEMRMMMVVVVVLVLVIAAVNEPKGKGSVLKGGAIPQPSNQDVWNVENVPFWSDSELTQQKARENRQRGRRR